MLIAKSNEHLQEWASKVKWRGWTENIKVIIWREIFAKNKNTKCPIEMLIAMMLIVDQSGAGDDCNNIDVFDDDDIDSKNDFDDFD